jgi:hypothetical protein
VIARRGVVGGLGAQVVGRIAGRRPAAAAVGAQREDGHREGVADGELTKGPADPQRVGGREAVGGQGLDHAV